MKTRSSSKNTVSSIIILVPFILFGKTDRDLSELDPSRKTIDSLLVLSDQSLGLVSANAHRYAAKALEISYRLQDDSGIFESRQQLGAVDLKRGQYQRAVTWFQENLQAAREQEYPLREARALHQLGVTLLAMGQTPEALRYMEEAITIYRKMDKPEVLELQVRCICDLGDARRLAGDPQGALEQYQQARSMAADHGINRELPDIFNRIGYLYQSLGQSDSASTYFHFAYFFSTHHKLQQSRVESLYNMAANSFASGKYELSEREAKKVLTMTAKDEDSPVKLEAIRLVARSYYALGKYDSSATYYQQFADLNDQEHQFHLASLQGVADELYEENLALGDERSLLRRALAGGGIMVLVLGLALASIFMRLRRKSRIMRTIKEDTSRLSEEDLHMYIQKVLEKNRMIDALNKTLMMTGGVPDSLERLFQPVLLAGEEWDRFMEKFDRVYPDFRETMKSGQAGIETKIRMLRHLNLDSKDAALLLGLSQESVREVLAGGPVDFVVPEPKKIVIL